MNTDRILTNTRVSLERVGEGKGKDVEGGGKERVFVRGGLVLENGGETRHCTSSLDWRQLMPAEMGVVSLLVWEHGNLTLTMECSLLSLFRGLSLSEEVQNWVGSRCGREESVAVVPMKIY